MCTAPCWVPFEWVDPTTLASPTKGWCIFTTTSAARSWPGRTAGKHTLKISMVDPTIVIQRIVICDGSLPASYFGAARASGERHLKPWDPPPFERVSRVLVRSATIRQRSRFDGFGREKATVPSAFSVLVHPSSIMRAHGSYFPVSSVRNADFELYATR